MTALLAELETAARNAVRPIYRRLRRKVPVGMRRRLIHARHFHRPLHLRIPRTFNEKMSWRMVHDRREALDPTCDKIAMKDMARARAADLVCIPRTLWSGTDVRELSMIELPEHWVLKPNHRAGLVYIGRGDPDVDDLERWTAGWLDEVNWTEQGEWAYSQADRTLLLEEFIGTPGTSPIDYKFQVFDGTVRLVIVYVGRFNGTRRYYLDRDFVPLGVGDVEDGRGKRELSDGNDAEDVVAKPPTYERMVEAAERIAQGFDYMGVDLYSVDDTIWFSETSPYEGGGGIKFRPASFDRTLGSYWILPRL